MKTVIIGASAHSTPALFDADFAFDAPDFSFELVGRSATRLAAVGRAIGLVAHHHRSDIDFQLSQKPADAIADADVVVVQFRIGGYIARAFDETFPHRYGLCGDEGLGPGGLAAAWRTWEELRIVLALVERSNPGATVVLLTSPIGILTRCARDAFPSVRVYGICELPWTTLGELCAAASADVHSASYAYLAVNHLGWFSDIRSGPVTVVDAGSTRPLKYVRLHDEPAEVLREQRSSPPRGLELADLAAAAFEIYENGSAADVLAALRRRNTPWYAHAVSPLLRSLAGDDTGVTFFLSAANDGYCSRFSDDDIIEMPFVARGGTLERITARSWQHDDIAATLARLLHYERSAAAAVVSRDVTRVATALRAHPWLDGTAISDRLIADVVAPMSC